MPKKHLSSLRNQHTKTLVELDNYKLLVESIEDYAIFHLDPHGYIMSWNKGAKRNKGYEESEIVGKHFSQFYLQNDVDAKKPERELEIAKKLGRIEDEDWRVRKDGSRFWANVIITALYDDKGELVGFAKVTRDLTERKQHEDELRRANMVLRDQSAQLSKLNEAKDEFISLASHQLRTPATAIKQLLGLILEGFHQEELSEELLSFISKAYESNERQLSIVNNLLRVAQLDAGKVSLRPTKVDIDALIKEVIDEQHESIAKRQQNVIIHVPSQPVYVNVDNKYFRMALENLIDNASKYTYSGGDITITISQTKKLSKITIADNGVGIEEKDMDRLFKKFSRLSNELSQKVAGSGLGLYWVYEVVALHHGKIEVKSKLGHGTSFIITIPTHTNYA